MVQAHTIKTPAEVRAEMEAARTTLAQWARDNDFKYMRVYDVISGRNKGLYGEAHKVAVKLGIKRGPEEAQSA